ncbi:MAG: ribokinase [Chloroflexi bacterium]|nr:ribokinase [Chloroflexota bacterium]MYK34581.1 ribokinase [Chloroflexota bacterium]
MAPTVVVLGSINMDLIGAAPRLPSPGETVLGGDFYTAPGGKGANQAVAAARMGASVRMVGRVGTDLFAPQLLDSLRASGVDVSGVMEDPDAASGVAMILLDASRENRILVASGANMRCDDTQVDAVKSALDGADALMLQCEIPAAASLKAARIAKEMGVHVVWDPAPAGAFPPEAYGLVDALTPNQAEAAALTGIDVTDVASAESAARALVQRGVRAVVVKMGEAGAFYLSDGDSGYVPPFEVEAVDTVAAGDAFGAAMTCALAEGKSLSEAVRSGAAAGALAVTRPGAQDAMPTRADVEALLV